MADTQQEFQFAVDSALLGELGEKLVSTVHVALTELVKNGYDADASQVTIQIFPELDGGPRIVIADDGSGMSLDEVRRYWMKIGTSNKVAEPLSPRYGRLKTGSKGIGRFACRRLGLNLRLRTCAELRFPKGKPSKFQTTTIVFDWAAFEAGVDVESVKCVGETTVASSGTPGTSLEIWGGSIDEWKTRGFDYLQRQLAVLASNRGAARPGFMEDPGFNVILEAPDLASGVIDLRSAVVDASWGTLTGHVDKGGRAVLALNAKGLGGTRKFVSTSRFSRVKGATIRIGILPSRKEEARKPELLASYVLGDLIDAWGGVQVRFNGFRMYPYGDSRDDWLSIDSDRGRRVGKPAGELFDFASGLSRVDAGRSLLNMLGMRNYLGQVDVTSRMKGLIPRIDRQGFIENDVLDEVRRFARFAIDWANIYRDHYIRIREHEEAERARAAIRPVLNLEGPEEEVVPKAASFLRGEIRRIVRRLPPTQQKETERTLVQTVKAIETASSESYKQLKHLRLVASASTLTLLFAHEVRTVIGGLGAASARLSQLARAVPEHSSDLVELSHQLRETKNRFDNLVGMTGIVGAFRSSDKLAQLHLKTAVERASQCFQLVTTNYSIDINSLAVPADLSVGPMAEGELFTVLLNVLSNSVKSVIAAGGPSRSIRFEAHELGDQTVLRILDTGVGLNPEFFDEVFTPFIADPSGELYDRLEARANPEDASLLGAGSGLGLSIARDVARSRKGDIHFVSADPPWSACVEVLLP